MGVFSRGSTAKLCSFALMCVGLSLPTSGQTSPAKSVVSSSGESCNVDSSELLNDKRLNLEQVGELRAELLDAHSMSSGILQQLTAQLVPFPTQLTRYYLRQEAMTPALRPISKQYDQQVAELTGEFLDALVPVLPRKEGAALNDAVYLVTDWQSHRFKPSTPSTMTCLQQSMGEVLPRLSFDEQLGLFRGKYFTIWASEAIAPHLVHLYGQFKGTTSESEEAQVRDYRNKIIEALYKADAPSARTIILEEIASPRPRVDIEALGLLPDETLPEMDAVFAQQLQAAYENATWYELLAKLAVIERYATGNIFRQIKALYSAHDKEWQREQRVLFLSYFLRVEPSVGRDLIEQWLKKKDSDTLLTEIANVRESPELEPIAIKELSNSDGRIAGNAADVLLRIGHADVEPLLWQGLEEWHNQWMGRSSSERDFPATAYRDGVVEALLYSHAWVMTKEKLERVHELGMPEDSVLGAVSNFPWWDDPIRVFAYKGPDEFQIKIGYYAYSSVEAAEQHLRMFPGGLHFAWCQQVDPTQEDTVRPVLERLSTIIAAQGSTIQVQAQD